MMTDKKFRAAAQTKYKKIRTRSPERKNKRGALLRPEIPMLFSVQQLIEWLRVLEIGDGVFECLYCHRPIDITEMELDHQTPLARGGNNELGNMAPSCKQCNQTKGELTKSEYRALLEFIRAQPLVAQNYILLCMRMIGVAKRKLMIEGK